MLVEAILIFFAETSRNMSDDHETRLFDDTPLLYADEKDKAV